MIPCSQIESRHTRGPVTSRLSETQRIDIRESYGCKCGPVRIVGRRNPKKTDYIYRAIEEFTGTRINECPWRCLENPLVSDAIGLHSHYETGNLGAFLTDHDLEIRWQALELYIRASNMVRSKQHDERMKELRKERHGK